MKKIVIAVSVSAVVALTGLRSLEAQVDSPSKVTGGGAFLDLGWWASPAAQPLSYPWEDEVWQQSWWENPMGSFETVTFSVNVSESGEAAVLADSPALRAFWGDKLRISGSWIGWVSIDPWAQDDKPPQQFKFEMIHPEHGAVAVWVFANDNWTPGAVADPFLADWVGIVIEPADGDGVLTYEPANYTPFGGPLEPGTNDNLFAQIGFLVRGNIMDHRLPGASTGGHGKKTTP